MDIFFKILKFIITAIVDIIVLSGLAIVLAWAIWDVTPQTSITKTAYFFSESWRLITGKPKRDTPIAQVTRPQLAPSEKHIQYLYK